VSDDVANASRDGTLVLMRPVTTSTGRRVGGQLEVDARGARLLGDPHDASSDVARRRHHQVGELVDDRRPMYGYGL
jgi:hypothetical protein